MATGNRATYGKGKIADTTLGGRTMGKASGTVFVIVGVIFVLGGAMREATASDREDNRSTLQGLNGVRVLVEDTEPEIEQRGL